MFQKTLSLSVYVVHQQGSQYDTFQSVDELLLKTIDHLENMEYFLVLILQNNSTYYVKDFYLTILLGTPVSYTHLTLPTNREV